MSKKRMHLKNNPFSVPDGYFDQLPQQIGQKITQFSTQDAHHMHSHVYYKKIWGSQLALAASFILMIGLGYGVVRLISPHQIDTEPYDTDPISLFQTYTLLQNDEWEEPLDSEQIITFLTEHGISPNAIAYLD